MKKTTTQRSSSLLLLAAAVAFMSTGCGGFGVSKNLASSPAETSSGGGTSGSGGDSPSTVAKFTCSQPDQAGQADKMRRLTKQEILDSLTGILGTSIMSTATAEANAIPDDSTSNLVREFEPNHSLAHMTAMMELGLKLGSAVDSNLAFKQKFASCWPSSGTPSDACIQTFISSFGLRFFRRPLTADEVSFFLTAYKGFSSTPVRGLVSLFVQVPNFLFQIEEGSDTVNGTRVHLTDYEIASRLSFRLTGASPDDELYAAAAKGTLSTQGGVDAEAQRLLATPQGQARIQFFFSEYADLRKVPQVLPILPDLPDSNVTALRQDMIDEYQSLISQVVVKGNADFKTLFTTPSVFPKSSRLATVYGTSVWDGNSTPPSSTQGHRGILMRAALLASGTIQTSIILRGVRVRRDLLCDPLMSPPLVIIQTRDQQDPGYTPDKYSNRQLVEEKTSPSACMGCHSQINPIGYALEGYNQFGMKRTQQTALDTTGKVIATFPVDTHVDDAALESDITGSVNDATQLVTDIANGYKARACLSQQMFEFARLRPFVPSDACSISYIESSLIAGGSIKDAFYKSVVNSEIFWKPAVQ